MGELVRRLDYERRSKQRSLLKNAVGGQRINKEYSNTVRSANAMEERKKDLYFDRIEHHKKLFLDRFTYEKKVIDKFKDALDAKSQDFDEVKFQQLHRAQSARGRLQSNAQNTHIGPISEIIPRHYYRVESAKPALGVKFDCEDSDKSEDSEDEDDGVINHENKNANDEFSDNQRSKSAASFHQVAKWNSMSKKNSSELLKRRRMSYVAFIKSAENRFVPAQNVRRQSAPPRVMSAFIPREVKSSSSRRSSIVTFRQDSASSHGSRTSLNEISNGTDDSNASRSFRLLKDSFKKKKIEQPNPKLEKFKLIKDDHLIRTENLHNRTLKRFEELFSQTVFNTLLKY